MRDVHMSWPAHDVVPDRGFLDFSRASSLLSELNAFSASISNMASGSGFSISSSSCGLHIRFHTSGRSRVENFFRDF